MEEFWNNIIKFCTDAGMSIILAIIVLIVGFKLTKFFVNRMVKGKGFSKLDKSVQGFFRSFIKIVLYALTISSVAMILGVPTTTFVTVFTSCGVAIGLALQGALANFAGGLLILLFKPFKVGDFVENDGIVGTVKEINVIYTIIVTPENKTVTIPNGSLTNSTVINYNENGTRRIDITACAAYDNDIDLVKKALNEVAEENEKILKDPAPLVRLMEHNESSLDYAFKVWVKADDYWDVYFDCMEAIKKKFDTYGIEIPFKQVDIHQR